MNRVYILFGSNIDKERNLPAAVQLLAEQCAILALSAVYESVPVGVLEQPNFLNAAALIETALDAATLKGTVLASIERQLKRRRTSDPNAPRTIDADIILFNDAVFDYDERHVPDPDLLKFPHVAVPIADLAPDLPHPETGEPMRLIAERLMRKVTAESGGRAPLWMRDDVGNW